MRAFAQDLRYGIRMLMREPGFAVVAIVVLALGTGANSAIFSLVNAILLRPLPYASPERLYQLDEVSPKGDPSGVSALDVRAFKQHASAIEGISMSRWQNVTLTGAEGAENVYGTRLSPGSLSLLGVRPAIGRIFTGDDFRADAPGAVLLSDRLWKRRFGGRPEVLGRTLMLNGAAHTIVGVMAPEFYFERRDELWTPWRLAGDEVANRDSRWRAIARVRRGVPIRQAQAEVDSIFRSIASDDARKGWTARLAPLAGEIAARSRPALLVLFGAVTLVLLIACFNVANLMLARSSARSREIAIREALGASGARVLRQLVAESLLLGLAGGIAGLALGAAGARGIVALIPTRIAAPRMDQVHVDWAVLLFTFGIAVVAACLFGAVPAFRASRTQLNDALRASGRGAGASPRSGQLRDFIIAAEVALSLILSVGAGLMLRSLERLLSVDPGFQPDRVLSLRIPLPSAMTEPSAQAAYCERMVRQIGRLPGVNSAAVIAPLPLGDVDVNCPFTVQGRRAGAGEMQLVKLRGVSAAYFQTMGIALRRGRLFDESDDKHAPGAVVVNETLARRYFPNEDPLGRRVSMSNPPGPPWLTVVGVVNDVKFSDLGARPAPELYREVRQFVFAPFAITLVIRAAGSDPAALAAIVQRQVRFINPDQPVMEVKPMRQVVSESTATPRLYSMLLSIFATIALTLTAAGLYGVLTYAVGRRGREIGVLMALGAPPSAILQAVLGRALALSGLGILAGIAGALALTRFLSSQLYGVQPSDLTTFAGVATLLLAVAAAAAYAPARRAIRSNPVEALRCE